MMTMIDTDIFRTILERISVPEDKIQKILEIYLTNSPKYQNKLGLTRLLKGFNIRKPQIDLVIYDLLN